MAAADSADQNSGPARLRVRPRHLWRQLRHNVLAVLVPPVCLSCRERIADYDALCPECWRQVAFIRAPLCDRLGIPLNIDTGPVIISAAAAAQPPLWRRARAAAHFTGPVRRLIHDFKFHDRPESRRLLARWLRHAASDVLADADLLVPVPLNRVRLAGRRFNQAAILAREISQLSGVPTDVFALERRRWTRPQVGLSRSERQANLAKAFAVRRRAVPRIAGRRIILVDDVMTTGSTMTAATRVLLASGAASVDVIAVAMVAETTAG